MAKRRQALGWRIAKVRDKQPDLWQILGISIRTGSNVKRSVQWFVLAVLAAAFLPGCASAPPAPPAPIVHQGPAMQPKAIVRSVHGKVAYATDGMFMPLRVSMELRAGTTIKTRPDSATYLQVNGFTSTIKVAEDSTVELTKMDILGGGDTETVLTVKSGTLLGSVRKLSARSSYEIHAPKGVAAIRGTDFQVFVQAGPAGQFFVMFTCVTGQLAVSSNVDGKDVTKVLTTGQCWAPGEGDVKGLPPSFYGGPNPGPTMVPPQPPPVDYIPPFNGGFAPNPAVDAGHNPYQRLTPAPVSAAPKPKPH
jgi:hypothetical protein